jgi:hypothetical protein
VSTSSLERALDSSIAGDRLIEALPTHMKPIVAFALATGWVSWHVQSGTSLPELMELGG